MKVLLDTNIIIHREMMHPVEADIGKLFLWMDRLQLEKCVHEVTLRELEKMADSKNRNAYMIKIQSYTHLHTIATLDPNVKSISEKFDRNQNDLVDTVLINEVYSDRVDILITEDRDIHKKAVELKIGDKVFSIDAFLEKVTTENPDLVEYKVPIVKKEFFGNINLKDHFFDSFREDYNGYDKWFNKKANEIAYVVKSENDILAFLYIKLERESETYSDINPRFEPKLRLKIGTLKVQLNGYKLGERLLKIVFDNALQYKVEEIYVTIFPKRLDQHRLINLLNDFGFRKYGIKASNSGIEEVYVRSFAKRASVKDPKSTYPFLNRKASKYIVPIYPDYHTSLFPESILKTESPMDFIENEPFRNAISKVYISRSYFKNIKKGDILVFYRTGGFYKSVVTTLGVVDSVYQSIENLQQFREVTQRRSVFSEKELNGIWEQSKLNRPFVVNFLYSYSFPKRINLKKLIELGVIKDVNSAPRGFELITDDSFEKIIMETKSNGHIVVDKT